MKNIRLILLTLFIAVLAALPATAAVYYVDIVNGTDDPFNGLTPGTGAWKTIHYAVDEIVASTGGNGDTLNIAAGTYSVSALVPGGESDSPLTFNGWSNSSILGDPAGGTIIDLNSAVSWANGIQLDFCSNVTASNLEITNAYNNGIYADGCTGTAITRCDIHNNSNFGVYLNNCNNTNTVSRNRVYDNPNGIGVYAQEENDPCSPLIVNNLIVTPEESMFQGIMVISTGYTYPAFASPTIFHNTIDGGGNDGIYLFTFGPFAITNPNIQYNIITGFGNNGINGGTDGYGGQLNPTLNYNDLFGNSTAYSGTGIGPGPNSIAVDPVYSGGGFELDPSSPCIDAATTSNITEDIDGTVRPQGTAPDMGCYEYPSGVITPEPVAYPGITVLPYEGLETSEDGNRATFTVKLDTLPSAPVVIPITSSDTGEGAVLPASLTFTANNWFTPQTVVVRGVDDSLVDGDIPYTVGVGPAVCNTFDYNGRSGHDVNVTNLDNDSADIIVDPTSGLRTSKFGGSDTFTVVLNSQPIAPVAVSLSSSDTSLGIPSPEALTFTPDNWSRPQTVTVTGQDNGIEEDAPYTIITAPAVSQDPIYNDLDADDVEVVNVYNMPPDQPGYVFPQPFQMFPPGTSITLRGSTFYDPEGDRHDQSWWRIAPLNRGAFGCEEYPGFFEHISGTDLTSYTIPTQNLKPGVVYVWIVGYKDEGSGAFTWSDLDERVKNTFMIGVEETIDLPPVPPGTTAAYFVMLSCHHYIPDNSSALAVIGDDLTGGYDSRYYRIGTYDPLQNDGGYKEYPGFSLLPGTAFWVLARNGLAIDLTGIAMTTAEDVDLPLMFNSNNNNGWNMIGPPNNQNYPWGNVQVVVFSQSNLCEPEFGPVTIGELDPNNPYIDTRLLEWDGQGYNEVSMMMAGYGYWVKVRQPRINLRFPVSAQASLKNPDVLMAVGMNKIKETAGELFSPNEALADDQNDMPPAPMATIDSDGVNASFGSSSGGNCFIESLRDK